MSSEKNLARVAGEPIIRRMNTNKLWLVSGMVFALALAVANESRAGNILSVGGRYHQAHSSFADLPYADGDLSYGALYEVREGDSTVQFGCSVTPEFDKRDDIDYAVTPELNLMLIDRVFQGGVGILSSYLSRNEGDSEWMDLYWQILLGLRLELSKSLTLQVSGSYVYEKWGDLGDFDFEDIEGVAYIGYAF